MNSWKTLAIAIGALGVGATGGVWLKSRPVGPAPNLATSSIGPLIKTARAEKRDMKLFANGIGHVQAINTVQIKTRVDGPIDKVMFVEGEQVAAGKALIQIDARPFRAAMAQAEGQLARDQALYQTAKADLERAFSLGDKGFASRQTIEQRQAQLDGVLASIKIDQAALDNAKLNLDFTTIRAPIAGRIGKRLIDAGNLVHGSDNTPLVELVQTRPITAFFTVPQGLIGEISRQMAEGPLAVEAISTDDRRLLSRGELVLIGNQVDPQSGTVELEGFFDNEDNALWSGQLIEARLTLSHRRAAVAVPLAAIAPSNDGEVVFVVDGDNRVRVRKVTLGPSSEGQTIIESGLEPGERVAVEKLDLLAPGLTIQPQAEVSINGTATPS